MPLCNCNCRGSWTAVAIIFSAIVGVLAVGIVATSVVSAILVGLLKFFLFLALTEAVCYVKVLVGCDG